VRALATFAFACWLCSTAFAQEQERSLVDRLLKPDMTLQNSAQNKKFIADGQSIDKHATVASFYVENKSNSRTFSGSRDFRSGQFDARSFWDAKHGNSSVKKTANSAPTFTGSSLHYPVRNSADQDKSAQAHEFAGQRPFLVRGKSQKSLDRHEPPMTIDQVRELLNKNK